MKPHRLTQLGLSLGALAIVLAACAAPASPTPVPTSPYTSLLDSPIRGLSLEEIQELETGAGAGFARAAELNGYPGPRHILDLQTELALSDDQRLQVQQLFDDMNSQARPLGADILQLETELELAFRTQTIDEASLEAQLTMLADKYGELRLLHLRTHLVAIKLLTPQQLAHYDELRGYAQPDSNNDHGGGHQP